MQKLLPSFYLILSYRGIQGAYNTANFKLMTRHVFVPKPRGTLAWHSSNHQMLLSNGYSFLNGSSMVKRRHKYWVILSYTTEERGQNRVSHQTAEPLVQTWFGPWTEADHPFYHCLFPTFQEKKIYVLTHSSHKQVLAFQVASLDCLKNVYMASHLHSYGLIASAQRMTQLLKVKP